MLLLLFYNTFPSVQSKAPIRQTADSGRFCGLQTWTAVKNDLASFLIGTLGLWSNTKAEGDPEQTGKTSHLLSPSLWQLHKVSLIGGTPQGEDIK